VGHAADAGADVIPTPIPTTLSNTSDSPDQVAEYGLLIGRVTTALTQPSELHDLRRHERDPAVGRRPRDQRSAHSVKRRSIPSLGPCSDSCHTAVASSGHEHLHGLQPGNDHGRRLHAGGADHRWRAVRAPTMQPSALWRLWGEASQPAPPRMRSRTMSSLRAPADQLWLLERRSGRRTRRRAGRGRSSTASRVTTRNRELRGRSITVRDCRRSGRVPCRSLIDLLSGRGAGVAS
jgi:hypothetical protein